MKSLTNREFTELAEDIQSLLEDKMGVDFSLSQENQIVNRKTTKRIVLSTEDFDTRVILTTEKI